MKRLDILIFGSDRVLSRTRAMLVRRAGYLAACAFDYEDALNVTLLERPLIVLFCCSVSDADRTNLIEQIAINSPGTKSLVAFEVGFEPADETGVEYFDSLEGPEHLLLRLNSMLGKG